jgi:hypothetical protein
MTMKIFKWNAEKNQVLAREQILTQTELLFEEIEKQVTSEFGVNPTWFG